MTTIAPFDKVSATALKAEATQKKAAAHLVVAKKMIATMGNAKTATLKLDAKVNRIVVAVKNPKATYTSKVLAAVNDEVLKYSASVQAISSAMSSNLTVAVSEKLPTTAIEAQLSNLSVLANKLTTLSALLRGSITASDEVVEIDENGYIKEDAPEIAVEVEDVASVEVEDIASDDLDAIDSEMDMTAMEDEAVEPLPTDTDEEMDFDDLSDLGVDATASDPADGSDAVDNLPAVASDDADTVVEGDADTVVEGDADTVVEGDAEEGLAETVEEAVEDSIEETASFGDELELPETGIDDMILSEILDSPVDLSDEDEVVSASKSTASVKLASATTEKKTLQTATTLASLFRNEVLG